MIKKLLTKFFKKNKSTTNTNYDYSEKYNTIDALIYGPPSTGKINIAEYVYKEATRWREYGKAVQNQSIYYQEAYTMLIFSIELYLKCLLSKNNCNILKKEYKIHYLYKLFNKLPKEIQNHIINQIHINPVDVIDKNKKVLYVLTTFDDFMKEIDNDFIELRYEYEKYNNKELIFVPIGFINQLCDTLHNLCTELIEK